jgi:hypothetical protein
MGIRCMYSRAVIDGLSVMDGLSVIDGLSVMDASIFMDAWIDFYLDCNLFQFLSIKKASAFLSFLFLLFYFLFSFIVR